ncbi:MAG TPA: hypothetical protein VFZ65_22275 [Planctomycetota bacterium]|nr:hypothetical protein [Planctomycetota bacterium]
MHAPQIVALSDQTAEIFVGKKRSVRLLPDGGAAAPVDGDSIELMVTPQVDRQTDRVALDLQVRSQFTSPNAARVAQPLVLGTGETAVLQRNAEPGVGALIFVTAAVIRQAQPSRLTR